MKIRTADLLDKLRWLRRHSKIRSATISPHLLGHVQVVAGPLDVLIPCIGELADAVTFDANALRALVLSPPAECEIEITYQNGTLQMGRMAIPAKGAKSQNRVQYRVQTRGRNDDTQQRQALRRTIAV